jgi:flavin-dependent dehydrogenase
MLNSTQHVAIIGGGLAGLTLALQLKLKNPGIRVTVLEREQLPYPEATHKVGESTVELAAHYFSEILGLREHLQTAQLRKLGLRLFFSSGDNSRIEQRFEMGSDHHLGSPTYQIDRGRFENYLVEQAQSLGISIITNARARAVILSPERTEHAVTYSHAEREQTISARWIVDATGRAGLLKRQLKLSAPSEHDSNAAWFRIKRRIDIDDWCPHPAWKTGHDGVYSRWYSTNHLTGAGYWVWLIPLASGYTSIGVVTDPKLHPLSRFRSFDQTLDWLMEFEPQCARELAPYRDDVADFVAIKHYAHKCSRVLSGDRWAVTGDAGVFIDPLYSPGSDFIAIQNTFITDVISRDLAGQRFIGRCEAYNLVYEELSESFLKSYLDQYPLFGDSRVMPLKVIWDYTLYWGFLAFVGIQQRFCDLESLSQIQDATKRIYARGAEMQDLLRRAHATTRAPIPAGMLDINRIPFLVELNRSLAKQNSQEEFLSRLRSNLDLIEMVFIKIAEIVESRVPTLSSASDLVDLLRDIPESLSKAA